MTNLYSKKTLDKIKAILKEDENIPLESFRCAVMSVLGTSYRNTEIWINNYETHGDIEISKNDGNCWVVNWVKK